MRRLPLLLVALLAGCGEPNAAAPAPSAEISANETMAERAPARAAPPVAPADPVAVAAASWAETQQPLRIVDGVDVTMPPRYFNVDDCNMVEGEPDPGAGEPAVEKVARRVALLRRSLRLAGYSTDLTERPLARYAAAAERMDDQAAETALQTLAAELDAARAGTRPDLPPVRAFGECGAAEAPVRFRTSPAGGRIWLITKFAFELCRARRLDPWDRAACDRWSEADPGQPMRLSGNYFVQARWPDGATLRGDRRIEPSDDGDAETAQLFTVAHP